MSKQRIDLLVTNATVYTVDENFSKTEAIAVDKGKIVETGSSKKLLEKYEATEMVDANGKFVFPGFIDAHAHIFGYGLGLQQANLVGTQSWNEVLQKVKSHSEKNKEGWLVGRGWNQNDWPEKDFPTNEKLNELFPARPAILVRVDGHAMIANDKALELADINHTTQTDGGEVQIKNGKLTGVLIDNAMDLVYHKMPKPSEMQVQEALQAAEENLFAAGLTTIVDCGQDYESALFVDSLQKKGKLKMRLFIMMSDKEKNYDFLFSNGKIKTDRLNVSSFKLFSDGALGSRGAYLLKPYSDKNDTRGLLLKPENYFDEKAKLIFENGFQMCTHAIGDAANRMMLNIYSKYLKGKNDRRWRIEHAQILDKKDFHYFGDYNIVPSVQPTHATSDMYWAEERLGKERMKTSYAFKDLLNENGWLPLGTDFPVEDISAIKTFYAAVFRKDSKQWPEGGFQIENALSREEAIRGMTLWAAKSCFEENEKGSIEAGKFADFVILDTDLMNAQEKEILHTQVLATYLNGEKMYENNAD
ncbi:MAG TPA: amidohydrolase [Hanamia sp.]|nr:amidohydrolase [Hanamia sp.]